MKALTLTPMDYVEIRQLVNRCAFALDTGSNNGYDYADLFTADGESMRPYAKGRKQLVAFALGDLTHRGPAFVREYLTNYIIQPSRGAAACRVYVVWIEVGENGKAGAIQGGGHYDDEYVKTREG